MDVTSMFSSVLQSALMFVDDNIGNVEQSKEDNQCYLENCPNEERLEQIQSMVSASEDGKLSSDSSSAIDRLVRRFDDIVEHQWIEGVGNEVSLTVGLTLFGIVLLLAFYLVQRYSNISRVSHSIHPSNLVAVNDARSQVQTTNAQGSTTSPLSTANYSSSSFFPSSPNYQQQPHRRHFATMDSNCPVCLNQLRFPIETNCGHLFCAQCIIIYWQHAQWRGGPIKCPVCRQQVTIMLPCFPTNNRNGSSSTSSFSSTTTTSASATASATTSATTTSSLSSSSILNTYPSSSLSANSNQNSFLQNGADPLMADSSTIIDNTPIDPQQERTRLVREINSYNRRFSGESRPWFDYLYDLPTLLRHMSMDFFSFNGLVYVFRIRIVLCFMAAIMYLISPLDMIPEAVFGIFGLLDDIVVVVLLAIYVTIIYRRFLIQRWEMD